MLTSRSCSLALVRPEGVSDAWPNLVWFVGEACEASNGRYRPEHIKEWAETGAWQLWPVIENEEILSLTATELITYPTGLKTIAFRFCVGTDRERWQHYIENILEWGRLQGCTWKEGVTRIGWRRIPIFKTWMHTHDFMEGPL